MTKILIGNDIGGSHITSMGVDPVGNIVSDVFKVRTEVDCRASADEIFSGWATAIGRLIGIIGRENLGGIGFAMPGPFDYPAGIAWFKGVQKFDSLYGVNVRKELRQRLDLGEDIPIRFLNDATSFAIGEAWTGMASGFRKNMAVTLGTGFGSAFIEDGIPVESGPEVPEWGCVYHLPYGDGIADDHFSTRWFLKRYREVCGTEINGVKEMSELALKDGRVFGIFREFGTNAAEFLAPWLLKFGAGCLTIGGNIALSWPIFEKSFMQSLEKNGCSIPVFISELGEMAAIAGSARLCNDDFYSRLPFISDR